MHAEEGEKYEEETKNKMEYLVRYFHIYILQQRIPRVWNEQVKKAAGAWDRDQMLCEYSTVPRNRPRFTQCNVVHSAIVFRFASRSRHRLSSSMSQLFNPCRKILGHCRKKDHFCFLASHALLIHKECVIRLTACAGDKKSLKSLWRPSRCVDYWTNYTYSV
jgi:hypothetical protein